MNQRSVRMAQRISVLLLLAGAAATAPGATPKFVDATAADSFKLYWLVKAETPPVLDGKLDDKIWQEAEPLTDWGKCNYGRKVGKLGRIDFRAAWDRRYLYVAARAVHDRHPNDMKVLRRQVADVTKAIYARECLEIHIDGNLDHATRFQSIVNPLGEKWMCWYYDFGWGILQNVDYGLDADWDCAARINKNGWTVEVRYALADIQVRPRVGAMFGINPCWFNWADSRDGKGEKYWWQFVTWSTHGDSHHDPRLYGRFILVDKRPRDTEAGLRLALPDLDKRRVLVQTRDGFLVFDRGRKTRLSYLDKVRAEVASARNAWKRLSDLLARAPAAVKKGRSAKRLADHGGQCTAIEKELAAKTSLTAAELKAYRGRLAKITEALDLAYWRAKQECLLTALK